MACLVAQHSHNNCAPDGRAEECRQYSHMPLYVLHGGVRLGKAARPTASATRTQLPHVSHARWPPRWTGCAHTVRAHLCTDRYSSTRVLARALDPGPWTLGLRAGWFPKTNTGIYIYIYTRRGPAMPRTLYSQKPKPLSFPSGCVLSRKLTTGPTWLKKSVSCSSVAS